MPVVNGIDSNLVANSNPSKSERSEARESKDSREPKEPRAQYIDDSDAVILDASFGTKLSESGKDSAKTGSFQELYQSLSLTAKEIVDKINEQLKTVLPDGVQSLTPEQVTPEATADRIVSGVTAFFDIYAKQNKNLQGSELVDSFIAEVTRGVNTGYGDAVKILEGVGAFKVDGVKDGIEKTRTLIDEKLAAFGELKKKELGANGAEEVTKKEILTQGGAGVSAVA